MQKLNQKGFTHHIVLFGLTVLVLGAVGFAGLRVYRANNINAKAGTWSQAPGTDTAVTKVNGPVLGGMYAEKEIDVATLTGVDSPLKTFASTEYRASDISGYDYKTGDLFYVYPARAGGANTAVTSYDFKKVSHTGASPTLLKSIPASGVYGVKMCVGAEYIAYTVNSGAYSSTYATTKDFSQARLVMNETQQRALGGGTTISSLSCGDQYFYTISDKKIFKSPFNNQRIIQGDVSKTGTITKSTVITIPDITSMYDLPDYNYSFCGKQYQKDSQLVVHYGELTVPRGIDVINPSNTKGSKVRNIPASSLNSTYWFCTLSPDGRYIANGKDVGIFDVYYTTKLKDLLPNSYASYPYGWSPIGKTAKETSTPAPQAPGPAPSPRP